MDCPGHASSRANGRIAFHYNCAAVLGFVLARYIMTTMKVIGIAGWSGAGKTTLLTRVIPHLTGRGLTVSTIKHAHHAFDVDQPGKDSHTHRTAGASEVLISSANRFALIHELRGAPELALGALLEKLSPIDLVLVEGFKREAHPKLEVYRESVGKPLLAPDDPHIIAIASDAPVAARVPVISLDDIEAVADILVARAAPRDAMLARVHA
jgi:molybdopterin-guanine dinucleotide biosynthesis protein B